MLSTENHNHPEICVSQGVLTYYSVITNELKTVKKSGLKVYLNQAGWQTEATSSEEAVHVNTAKSTTMVYYLRSELIDTVQYQAYVYFVRECVSI
jgi:hypothetical protein